MKYYFKKLDFAKRPPLVRMIFNEEKYQGLERFFNDDAALLKQELEELRQGKTRPPISYGGNRTVIEFAEEFVEISDQFESEQTGHFDTLILVQDQFWKLYDVWKQETEKTFEDDQLDEKW